MEVGAWVEVQGASGQVAEAGKKRRKKESREREKRGGWVEVAIERKYCSGLPRAS